MFGILERTLALICYWECGLFNGCLVYIQGSGSQTWISMTCITQGVFYKLFKSLFNFLILYVCVMPAFVFGHHIRTFCPMKSDRQLWVAVWVLGLTPRTSWRETTALSSQAIPKGDVDSAVAGSEGESGWLLIYWIKDFLLELYNNLARGKVESRLAQWFRYKSGR